ncbi:MerR family transcriptional regulator [Alkalihalophilus pseudofirmus]|uniref:MerR family transcriptional regulator n=1 Tax=Alkalihalophilus pseudofirmus TaxID=79885 RepID=A0AAJ2KZ31_ALKPS|nr:MerR family transcriptional regulator [Alkalihalophilus pseudofirmus]MDV2883694.1 MerR family transcriptional regulator [Alkalihalophilus pseudofirmus]
MEVKVKELAVLVGISVRTLHHYDEIGLLKPDTITDAGYRYYSENNLDTLQQILFYKELGFSLKHIKDVMKDPDFNQEEVLVWQRKMLLEKRDKLDQMIVTIDKTLQYKKGDIHMTNEEKFKGFDFSHNPYEQEAREHYGDKKVDETAKGMTQSLEDETNNLYRELAVIRYTDPASKEAQEAIKKWFILLNKIGSYSLEAFRGLGQMYILDERFTKNIDQFGDGLAQFMCEAMGRYADDHQ